MPFLAASTPLPSVLVPLAPVPVSRTFLGAFSTGGTSRTSCLLRANHHRYCRQLFSMNVSFLGGQTPSFKSTTNSLLFPSKPFPETFDRFTSVRWSSPLVYSGGSLRRVPHYCRGNSMCAEGLIRKRWCCARGWLIIAVLTGDTWNLIYYYFSVPHMMGIHSSRYQLIIPTHTSIQPHTTELVGSTKIPRRGFSKTFPEKQTS